MDFWELEVREFLFALKAYSSVEKEKHIALMSSVWTSAALQRMKKLPDYNRFMDGFKDESAKKSRIDELKEIDRLLKDKKIKR